MERGKERGEDSWARELVICFVHQVREERGISWGGVNISHTLRTIRSFGPGCHFLINLLWGCFGLRQGRPGIVEPPWGQTALKTDCAAEQPDFLSYACIQIWFPNTDRITSVSADVILLPFDVL